MICIMFFLKTRLNCILKFNKGICLKNKKDHLNKAVFLNL